MSGQSRRLGDDSVDLIIDQQLCVGIYIDHIRIHAIADRTRRCPARASISQLYGIARIPSDRHLMDAAYLRVAKVQHVRQAHLQRIRRRIAQIDLAAASLLHRCGQIERPVARRIHAEPDIAHRMRLTIGRRVAAHQTNQVAVVSADFLKNSLGHLTKRFDKSGDHFYDQISALHKSVRGSNTDGALYWFCRMIDGGADPKYLARRIIRMAWEDIGLADPRAMQLANDAALTYERLGSPEGELALAEALIYLAAAPKSNAAYKAYNQARAFVNEHGSDEVPIHLRNAPTKLMKELGHGKAYRYAHDEPHAYAAGETYLPDGIKDQAWYQPTDRGLETKIKEKLAFLKSLDDQSKKK